MTEINALLTAFKEALDRFDRQAALAVALKALEDGDLDIPSLYEQVIAPSLNRIASNAEVQKIPIWQEHLQSNIVRTVVENLYPYVVSKAAAVKEKGSSQNSNESSPEGFSQPLALVVCLEEEYHELGARMTADYLTLVGFNTYFVGANTPRGEILSAILTLAPQVVCVSVTNYFHLTRLQHLITALKGDWTLQPFKLAVGGYAVHHSSNVSALVTADFYLKDFNDIQKMQEALR